MNKELVAIFEYLEREKGIKRNIIVQAIEESLLLAAKKSIKNIGSNIEVHIDTKTGDIYVTSEKEVVEVCSNPSKEIPLEESQELGIDCEVGDIVRIPIPPHDLGRIAAQTAKQVISQKLRMAEKDVIYEEYRHRVGELVSGSIKRVAKGGSLIVDLGKVEAILPDRFLPKMEKYHVGDRILALLLEVRDTDIGGAEVVLSRSHPEFVVELFKQEVPELHDEVISIKKIVRDPGYRTKLMVSSLDPKIDPLGACVGVRGTRIKNIIREINNEKIDIVTYQEDPLGILQDILSPIEIKKIHTDDGCISIVVDDDDYPKVIGKRGTNARLNGALLNVELDVKKMSEYQKELAFEKQRLSLLDDPELDEDIDIEGISPFIVDSLKEAGYNTRRKVLNATPEELMKATSIGREMIDDIIEKIRKKTKR